MDCGAPGTDVAGVVNTVAFVRVSYPFVTLGRPVVVRPVASTDVASSASGYPRNVGTRMYRTDKLIYSGRNPISAIFPSFVKPKLTRIGVVPKIARYPRRSRPSPS